VPRSIALLAATVLAALVLAPPSASAATHTKSFDVPVALKPYQVVQTTSRVPRPNVDGFITAMSVNVVDRDGTPVPIQRLMLHHVVFMALGKLNPMCDSVTGYDSRTYHGDFAQPFYGAGEERNMLFLPQGYGYPISKAGDKDFSRWWAMVWMVMNHRGVSDSALIRYTVTWDDSPDIKPALPIWLDVRPCIVDPFFNVPGGGGQGSTYKRSHTYRMPQSGRIIAGGGHVHGGAKNVTVTEPDCANRTVFKSVPAWGTRKNAFYHVRPILHEPGPISMSGTLFPTGYPIAKGERIRVTANYDNERPHTRVMGISVIYVAHGKASRCAEPPSDRVTAQPAELRGEHFRKRSPKFTVPLTAIGKDGKAHEIDRPPGKTYSREDGDTINVGSDFFGPPNVAVARGARLNWRFLGSALHNVTLANGPRGFSSANLSDDRTFKFRFKVPGTYKIFCSLHPVTMAQTVEVK
jgi:plastocyanin